MRPTWRDLVTFGLAALLASVCATLVQFAQEAGGLPAWATALAWGLTGALWLMTAMLVRRRWR